jgi:hypothetical protein
MDRTVTFKSIYERKVHLLNKQSNEHYTNKQKLCNKLKSNKNNDSIQIQFKIIDVLKQQPVGQLRNTRKRLKLKNLRQTHENYVKEH